MTYSIQLEPRMLLGRRAKHVHAAGNIPGVVYGHGVPPQSIQVKRSDFRKLYREVGTSSLVELVRDDLAPVKALIQDVQLHPITMEPYHIDFRQIRMDEAIAVEVPLRFVGESKAVKEMAGTLIHPIAMVHVKCLPANLPHEIEVDLSVLQTFEAVITVGNLNIPAGVTVLDDPRVTVATVTPPLTEEQLKKLEAAETVDVSAIKTEAEEKKAAEAVKQAEEAKLVNDSGSKKS